MFTKNYKSISARIVFALVLITGFFRVTPSQASGLILYIKANATGANNGTSWTDAYTDLQSALAVATSGDQIWVAAGTYRPTTDSDRMVSFTLKNGVEMYGGFAGDDAIIERDPATYVTILSGDIGTVGDNSDNSYHVVSGADIDNTTILDGFTIKFGNAFSISNGGGLYNNNSSPTLTNLIFSGNSANQGGGICNENNSNPTLTNVTFTSNSGVNGGGMVNIASNPTLLNVVFISNSVTGYSEAYGGGLSNQSSSPTLTNVTFSSNSSIYGGGISNYPYSNPILNNVTFNGNTATVGGGIYNYRSSPSLTNVTFSGNSATSSGGGIANSTNSSPSLTNVTFSGNSAVGFYGGGLANVSNSNPIIRNSILYDYGTEIYNSSSSPSITYSIVQGGYAGTGNLNVNPLLGVLKNNGGFTKTMAIGGNSPAVDAGSDANCPTTDQRGVTRPQWNHCDIGAYEFDRDPATLRVKWDATGANNGTSWIDAYTDLQSALAAASTNDEIWVAAGTYKPTTGTDRTVSFTLKNGVAIYGGFAGTETLRTQRDFQTNLTILTGEIGHAEISDNSFHVVVGGDTDNTAALDGFTITKGNADELFDPHAWGGGMHILGGSPSLSNLVFTANTARSGGGIALDNSDSVLSNVTFQGNSAESAGGMLVVAGNPTLMGLTFRENTAAFSGGGMNISNSDPILENVTFYGNVANMGAGIYTYGSPVLKNVTLSGNTANNIGGGIYNESSNPTIINSILWNNAGGEIVNIDENTPNVSYSIVQGGYPGTGNLNANPLLGPLADNGGPIQTMALGARSPAIDAGNDASCSATDQRGVARPYGSHCDIGAYEYDHEPATFYVKWNATGENNGTSWTDAYTNLQSALAVAISGDEIWVAAGTYKPTTGTDRSVSFTLKNGVEMYGGFAGDDETYTPRDPATYVTVLSGDIGGVGNNSDNSYHVVIGSNTDNFTVLDGFTITAGNADGVDADNSGGGGLYIIDGAPTLNNLIVRGNYAGSGGGIFNEDRYGMDSLDLVNVTFEDNSVFYYGGGIFNVQGTVIITNGVFSGNAAQFGGGIYNQFAGLVTMVNNTLLTNTASDTGGGIYNYGTVNITNSTFSENSVTGLGGGIYNYGTAVITNSTYSGNAAMGNGGGAYNAGTMSIVNSTFSGNSALSGGGILGFNVLNINNTIIANSISGEDCLTYAGATVNGKNNLIEGTGNACSLINGVNGNIIGSDPILGVLTNNGGFTRTMALLAGSPAIDAGNDSVCPTSDQRGMSRPRGLHCDMGAFETGSSLPTFEWNTFQGGALEDRASDVAIDQLGNIYITGESDSAQWEGNPINPLAGGVDAYVAKFSPEGHLLWYTFLGSDFQYYDYDSSSGIAVDESGNIYVHGTSDSAWGDNPVNGFVGEFVSNAFVAKLNPSGNLLWHTFLGGPKYDYAGGIELGANGDIYIVGSSYDDWGDTVSTPIRPFSREYPNSDAFIAKLSPSGVLQWHTFLGGTDYDYGNEINFEGNGNIYIAGGSDATWGDSPIHNFSGDEDAFVAKISSAGELLWNTFLGGSGNDMALGLTTDVSGEVLVAGGSSSSWGSNPVHSYSGFGDGFLAKLDADGMMKWNTFFGGAAFDHAADVVINDADHSIMVIGVSETVWGDSPSFPYNEDGKYFLAQFHPDGALQWNSFFGQSIVYGFTLNSLAMRDGNIVATGWSENPWGTPVHAYNAGMDVYVLKMKVNNTPPVATQSIPLSAGWNLVSFMIKPTDTNISSVLSSIEGNYDLVYTWDATGAHAGSGNWLKADNIPASPDSLTVLNETMGFWVHMTSADTLQVTGTAPQTTNIPLLDNAGGWNLVSYPSSVNGTLPGILTDHGVTNFSLVYAYHPEDVGDPWKLFDTTAPIFLNDLTQLMSGWGHWIKVDADHTWVVGYGAP